MAIFINSGVSIFSLLINNSKSVRQLFKSSTNGGTYTAVDGIVPPIQFWDILNSPGVFFSPLTPSSNILCISLNNRLQMGNPSLILSILKFVAFT